MPGYDEAPTATNDFVWNQVVRHAEAGVVLLVGISFMVKPNMFISQLAESQKQIVPTTMAVQTQLEFLTRFAGLCSAVFGGTLYALGANADKKKRTSALGVLALGDLTHLAIIYHLDRLSSTFTKQQAAVSFGLFCLRMSALIF
jgi:hypothetical protein